MAVPDPQYPVNLTVAGRRCLVVGGGGVAARKAGGLLGCGALVHVVAERVGKAVRALAGLSWEERTYRPGEVAGYRLAVAATDRAEVNAAVYRDGEAAGVWVNSADDPHACSFTLPSVVRQGSLMVAISTGGRSPALAAWLASHVSEEMGPEYQALAELASDERDAVKAAGGTTASLDWKTAFDSDMLDLLRAGEVDRARERLRACLS